VFDLLSTIRDSSYSKGVLVLVSSFVMGAAFFWGFLNSRALSRETIYNPLFPPHSASGHLPGKVSVCSVFPKVGLWYFPHLPRFRVVNGAPRYRLPGRSPCRFSGPSSYHGRYAKWPTFCFQDVLSQFPPPSSMIPKPPPRLETFLYPRPGRTDPGRTSLSDSFFIPDRCFPPFWL